MWSQLDPARLGPKAAELLHDASCPRVVASISTLEIARLCSQGRLELKLSPAEWVRSTRAALGARSADLTDDIAAEAYALPPPLHGDPADRVLVATARIGSLTLVTADGLLLRYPHVDTVDARK